MPTLTEVGSYGLTAPWHAAVVILCGAFPRDREVWARVDRGQSMDLTPLLRDTDRPLPDRMLLACAQGLVDGQTVLPVAELVRLSDARLRLVLDALAIARGGLPID